MKRSILDLFPGKKNSKELASFYMDCCLTSSKVGAAMMRVRLKYSGAMTGGRYWIASSSDDIRVVVSGLVIK